MLLQLLYSPPTLCTGNKVTIPQLPENELEHSLFLNQFVLPSKWLPDYNCDKLSCFEQFTLCLSNKKFTLSAYAVVIITPVRHNNCKNYCTCSNNNDTGEEGGGSTFIGQSCKGRYILKAQKPNICGFSLLHGIFSLYLTDWRSILQLELMQQFVPPCF